MRTLHLRRDSVLCRVITSLLAFGFAANVLANPTGMKVGRGSASVQQSGSQLTVTASQNAFLNWNSFNIAAGETTTFVQPSASSIVWNRINDQNPSQIYGSIQANGVVVLLNSSGFYFGPNSFVSAAGLVVSTANCAPPENGGGSWEFNGPPPLASIINYGHIQVGNGGSAFLIADKIENHGTIEAPGGSIGLAAGQTITLSERPDGRGMSMLVTLPQGSVDNYGNLVADGGTISLNAKVVNQNGLVQANSVQNINGVIELVASDSLTLGAESQIIANGDDSSSGSDGGQIMLQTPGTFSDNAGSQIQYRGGANGGNGGRVLIYDAQASVKSQLDGSANSGFMAGSAYYYSQADSSDLILTASSLAPFAGFSSILFQRSGNISLAAGTTWDLGAGNGQLKLQAGGNIILNSGSKIFDANAWTVTLQAGYDFVGQAVNYGQGSIQLNGTSAIQMAAGKISLTAGRDITVNSGYVRTTGGGDVSAWALAGNINTGTYAHGYTFSSVNSLSSIYYRVDQVNGVGGISTQAGGDVSIIAGGDVTSYLPYGNSSATIGGDAGTGAFGPQAGDVTIVAGGNVTGHYVVANGAGSINAGVQMDATGNPVTDAGGHYVLDANSAGSAGTADNKLALSLIAGGWTVNAARDINLQEVRNPNGIFNKFNSGGTIKPSYHYFNYATDAYVNLSAGNAVLLGDSSSSLPRDNSDGVDVPFIYAPILNISAGAGGVTLKGDSDPYNKLILFPSPQGSLTLSTTGGGALTGSLPNNSDGSPAIFNLIVSDSGQTQFYDNLDIFGLTDHAATPVHLNNPTPIVLNIAGDMSYVLLGAPEAAQITVGGDMINSRFQGMNLATDPNQSLLVAVRNLDGSLGTATVTPGRSSITVAGDIQNRSEFTTVTAVTAPNVSFLAQAYPPSPLAANLANSLLYDPVSKSLTIQGPVTQDVLNLLTQEIQYQVYVNGVPQFDAQGNPKTATGTVMDQATADALAAEYAVLGPVPTTRDSGYVLGGGGQFNVTAHNIDLGTTLGIQSQGVSGDTIQVLDGNGNQTIVYPLAKYFTSGADINVNVSGKLDMFSTSIASLNGGNISVIAGGDIQVGSDLFLGANTAPRGIFTTGPSDVFVLANGDINVNGSRIAAYDGGNVTVESLNGDINAGSGGSGYVVLSAYYVDPATHQVYSTSPTIPGSGILTTTFPKRDAHYPAPAVTVGNILVEAPNGKINASAGGIIQLALNGADNSASTVAVLAGYEMRDGQGQPVTAANLAAGAPVLVSDNRDIDASGSGVIAQNAVLKASGDITGLIFAQGNIDVAAVNNVNVTALAQGTANVAAGGNVSGTIIGVGGVSASGASIDAALLSNNSISGATSGQSGLAPGTAANATSQAEQTEDVAKTADSGTGDDTDEQNKKKKAITLAQKVSRVTVLLPTKTN
ncbi:MAG TPA: filamentous hemagglutinin N-terminal domain-containing protein [Verrucomicrobiae bacterium]|nr:filamentous hemagglutinin N-terminal domain-containing protein [Verrucomicrobiae bacterium]